MVAQMLNELFGQNILKSTMQRNWPTVNGQILREIVNQKGRDIYKRTEELELLLVKYKVDAVEIHQILLAIQGSSIRRYLEQRCIYAVDINNIIRSATRSGLSNNTARKIIADLLYGLNVPLSVEDLLREQTEIDAVSATLYVPPEIYEDEMKKILEELSENGKLSTENMSRLAAFARACIPEANRILGYLYYYGTSVTQNLKQAKEYLRQAAANDDAEAAGLLGDYFFDGEEYEKAYQFYTCPGALIQNEMRSEHMWTLLKMKAQSEKNSVFWVGMYILMEMLMFFVFPLVCLGESHIFLTIIFTFLNTAAIVLLIAMKRSLPFTGLRYSGNLLLSTFIAYTVLYILL
ncbi:MAG: hypothetical protein Q4E24_01685 [bacterium]|nr:hypothetical protein [bacterium]